jgi:hypothetical protein
MSSDNKEFHMRKIFSAVIVGTFVAMGFSAAASASTYVWTDKVDGFTFSFPDSWTIQTEDVPSTKIRIAGPIGEDFATCRVKAEKDGRLKIYPKPLMAEGVMETLDRDFWEHEIGEHENAVLTEYYAPAGLGGKGDATAAKASFVQDNGTGKMNMYTAMIASIYGDTRYVVSCSSKLEEYKKYAPLFGSIMGSVELDSRYHPFAVGNYRNFLTDPKVMFPRTKPGTIYPKNQFVFPSIFN